MLFRYRFDRNVRRCYCNFRLCIVWVLVTSQHFSCDRAAATAYIAWCGEESEAGARTGVLGRREVRQKDRAANAGYWVL